MSLDWRRRRVSAAKAVSVVRPGDKVFIGTACAAPRTLLHALEQLGTPGVTLVHFLTTGVDSDDPSWSNYQHRVFFVGSVERELLNPAACSTPRCRWRMFRGCSTAGSLRSTLRWCRLRPRIPTNL